MAHARLRSRGTFRLCLSPKHAAAAALQLQAPAHPAPRTAHPGAWPAIGLTSRALEESENGSLASRYYSTSPAIHHRGTSSASSAPALVALVALCDQEPPFARDFPYATSSGLLGVVCCMNAATYYSELIDWLLSHVTESDMFLVQSAVTCCALFWYVWPLVCLASIVS